LDTWLEPAPEDVAEWPFILPGDPVLVRRRITRAHDQPVALAISYLPDTEHADTLLHLTPGGPTPEACTAGSPRPTSPRAISPRPSAPTPPPPPKPASCASPRAPRVLRITRVASTPAPVHPDDYNDADANEQTDAARSEAAQLEVDPVEVTFIVATGHRWELVYGLPAD